jgi:molybdenum cofactor guanylyltransferase
MRESPGQATPTRAHRPALAAVVLAGGESRRFGTDKLVAPLEGKPLVAHVVSHLRLVTPFVYLSVESSVHARRLTSLLSEDVSVIEDRDEVRGTGPAAGIVSSVLALDQEELLFLAGDMPWVSPDALARLRDAARAATLGVACPAQENGIVDSLVQFQKREAVLPLVREFLTQRSRPIRPIDFLRATHRGGVVPRAGLSDDPSTFENVNTVRDLERGTGAPSSSRAPSSAASASGRRASSTIRIPEHGPELFWSAHRLRRRQMPEEAAHAFQQEAALYRRLQLGHLEYHCLIDASLCLTEVGKTDLELERRCITLRGGLFPGGENG